MPSKFTEYALTLAVGLIMLVSITASFHGMYENVEVQVMQQKLEAITQSVAHHVLEIYAFRQEANGAVDWRITVQIELPVTIGSLNFFQIKVIDSTGDQNPDSLYGFLELKREVSTLIDLSPITDQIRVQGSFDSFYNNHYLQYTHGEATLTLKSN